MDVNQLILLVKNKIQKNVILEDIVIKDKTYLHSKHSSHQKGKFHLELNIKSKDLEKYNKIQATRKIYNIIQEEIKKYIHSIQILIN